MRWYRCWFLVAQVLLCATATADESIEQWTSARFDHVFTDQWSAHLKSRVRFDQDVSRVKDFVLSPYVSWKPWTSIALSGGYEFRQGIGDRVRTEHRIWQTAEHRFDWRDLTVKNRIRLGQRFIEDIDGVIVRFRHRLRVTHPIGDSDWYGVIGNEVFVNLNDQGIGPIGGFEQNRIRAAAGVRFPGRLRVEAGYEIHAADRRDELSIGRHIFFLEFYVDTRP